MLSVYMMQNLRNFQFAQFFFNFVLLLQCTIPHIFTAASFSNDKILANVPNMDAGTQILIINNAAKRNKSSRDQPKFVIPEGYKKENRPTLLANEPLFVWFDIHVVAINPIKAADMDFRMDMTLSQRWIDEHLNFSDEWFDENREFFILPLEYTENIWHPDPYIVNAKSTDVGQLTQRLVSVYIFRNQTVHYITNLFATVACAMNYKYYPYDHQVCPMYIESFSYDETQVKYFWAEEDDAFTINPKLRMLQFQLTRPLHYHETSVPRYLEAKNFSQLIACFRFDRLLGNHIIQTFAPCSLIVCLSWFSFWLELNALSARMSLVVTAILTLVTQFVGLKVDFPPVAYVKAVDLWMAGCLICVFGSLGEFILVKVLFSVTEDVKFQYYEKRQFEEEAERINQGNHTNGEEAAVIFNGNDFNTVAYRRNGLARSFGGTFNVSNHDHCRHRQSFSMDESVYLDKAVFGKLRIPLQWTNPTNGHTVLLWRKIDNFSKWFFPLAFVIFCSLYWLVLYLHYMSTKVQPYSRKFDLYKSACVE